MEGSVTPGSVKKVYIIKKPEGTPNEPKPNTPKVNTTKKNNKTNSLKLAPNNYSGKTKKQLQKIGETKGIRIAKSWTLDKMLTTLRSVKPVEETVNSVEKITVPELEQLKDVLSNKTAQKGLIKLYADSQSECMRNGKCGMEIGMSREKDQGAVLKLFMGDAINLELDNSLTEDYKIGNEEISAKHSQGKVGTPVKLKWTSDNESIDKVVKEFLEGAKYPNLLLTYIDMKNKIITIVCIDSNYHSEVIKTLGEAALKVTKGKNTRGIEYSSAAMKEFVKKPYFKIEIPDADLSGGMDTIERRIKILVDMGIKP